jgi:subtilisin family serine protease
MSYGKTFAAIILIIAVFAFSYNRFPALEQRSIGGEVFGEEQRYLVKYKEAESNQNGLVGIAHAESKESDKWQSVKVNSEKELQALKANKNIERIEIDRKRQLLAPNDSYYNSQNNVISGQYDQWNLRSIGLTPTTDPNSGWNISTGSEETVIAVLDTGIALQNPDLANGSGSNYEINNLWINQAEIPALIKTAMDVDTSGSVDSVEMIEYFIANNEDNNSDSKINFLDMVISGSPLLNGVDNDSNGVIDDVLGFNFADNNPNANDIAGHGTHVSGIIAASTNNNATVNPGVAGVCWTCKVMPLKVVGSGGFAFDSDIADAIHYAIDEGAKVINMSLGGPGYSFSLQDAITDAWDAGVLVVSASGNFGSSASDSYPGGATQTLSVGAIDYNNQVAFYSNVGGKLDIVAPGERVLSTYPTADGVCFNGGNYDCAGGTSMAAPHIAGLAGLLFDLHKDDPDPWTAKEVRYALLQNTSELPTPQTGRNDCFIEAGFDNCSGFGKANAKAALEASVIPNDITAPIASLNPFLSTINGMVNITGTASDDNIYLYTVTFQRTSDNYITKQYSGRMSATDGILLTVDTTEIIDDNYNVFMQVEDFFGNITVSNSVQTTVDNTPPAAFSLLTPANGTSTTELRPTFTWETSTGASIYDFYLDNSVVTGNLNTTSYTLQTDLSEGAHTWFVIARDNLGNPIQAPHFIIIESWHTYHKSKGDFNFDGKVDLSDLSILAARWFTSNTVADANADGVTNLSDLSILAANWMQTV